MKNFFLLSCLIFSLTISCGSKGISVNELSVTKESVPVNSDLIEVQDQPALSLSSSRGFDGLNSSELNCLIDELLVFLDPNEVASITSIGPSSSQVQIVISALKNCDLVIKVAELGFTNNSVIPNIDPTCVLEGMTNEEILPFLMVLLDGSNQESIDSYLRDTPIIKNLVRCNLEDFVDIKDRSEQIFCTSLLDRIAEIIAAVASSNESVTNANLIAELFSLADSIFIWLADNVPSDYQTDAILVRDASIRISELIVESFNNLGSSTDLEAVETALFGALTQIDVELSQKSEELSKAQLRLESYVSSMCGESAAELFVLFGAGAPTGV